MLRQMLVRDIEVVKQIPALCVVLFLVSAFITFECAAAALDPRKPIPQYIHDTWNVRDELPHPTVQAILQTRDGYIWLGTHGGLARFDGLKFVTFGTNEDGGIRDNRIACLMEARDGSLWIGTDGGGLSRLTGGQWTSYSVQEGLAHERIKAMIEGKDGALWIATYGGGLIRCKDGRFSNYTEKHGLADKHVLSLCEDHTGVLWIGTRRGLNRMVSGKITKYFEEPAFLDSAIPSLYEDREGRVWVSATGHGLFRLTGREWIRYSARDGLPSRNVQAIYQDEQGTVWIGTSGGGLARLSEGRFSLFSNKDGLSDQNVRSIAGDREGNLWIGTEDGLDKLSENFFVTFTTRDGVANDNSNSIFESQDGGIWVAAKNGELSCLRSGAWFRYSARDGLLGTEIGPLSESRDGSLWIGSYSGLIQYKDGKFTNRTAQLRYPHVSAIGRSGDDVLVATGMRLSRFRDGKLLGHIEIPLDLKYVFEIHQDGKGRLWLATRAGLGLLDGNRWKVYTARDGLPSDVVYALHMDKKGDLWLATRGGLSRLRDGKFHSYTTSDGLFDNAIFRVLEDDRDNLWLTCSRGIFRVNKDELDAHALGRRTTVHVVSYGAGDGLKSVECAGPTQPAGWKSRDGRLWFPTIKGVAVIDASRVARNRLMPSVVIERLVADGKAVTIADGIRLPPGKGNLEFQYTAPSFVAPKKILFKRMLEGYDKEWIDVGSARTASYTNIPPGKYRFRVSAANSDGLWSNEETGIGLYLSPHFYQTLWFYMLCAGLVLFAAHRFYVMRVRRMKAEFAAVTEERNRIAREIHDTVAQGFAGISTQLEAGKQMISDSPRLAEEHLDQANILARSCLEELRRYVWNLRHRDQGPGDLAARLSELARTVADGMPFQCTVCGTPRPLSQAVQTILLRIGQEAILNAVKHAHAQRIEAEILFESRRVRLRVKDDGCGFNPGQQQTTGDEHFGLIGMKERARQAGGRLTVKSSPGEGTQIEALVPLHA